MVIEIYIICISIVVKLLISILKVSRSSGSFYGVFELILKLSALISHLNLLKDMNNFRWNCQALIIMCVLRFQLQLLSAQWSSYFSAKVFNEIVT